MKKKTLPRKLGLMAVFVTTGLCLQIAENQLPTVAVPGGKLGLANIVSILNIFVLGGKNAVVVAALRAFLGSLLSGGATTIPYSLAGAVLSALAMWLAKKYFYPKLSMVGISIIGAAVHNAAQVAVAAFVFSTPYIFSYLSGLLIIAILSGCATGYAAQILYKRVLKGDLSI